MDHTETDHPSPAILAGKGIYTYTTLEPVASERPAWCVQDLLVTGSVNALVGDSGLGKTALVAQLATCVAAGIDFLGWPVRQGKVLYCDYESSPRSFLVMQKALSVHLGLTAPPESLYAWSPNWPGASGDLMDQARRCAADLVVVDPIRQAYPAVEKRPEFAVDAVREMKRSGGTWLFVHHRRKSNQQFSPPLLAESPSEWLQETAGTRGIINHTDTRLGIDTSDKPQADLVVRGFVRLEGLTPPIYIKRVMDAFGSPLGYQRVTGADLLNARDSAIYSQLNRHFSFTDVQTAFSNSGSGATRFLAHCRQLGLVALKNPADKRQGYEKCSGVDGVSGAVQGGGH